jgi:hypothetical protein
MKCNAKVRLCRYQRSVVNITGQEAAVQYKMLTTRAEVRTDEDQVSNSAALCTQQDRSQLYSTRCVQPVPAQVTHRLAYMKGRGADFQHTHVTLCRMDCAGGCLDRFWIRSASASAS